MKKKLLSILLSASMTATLLTGCGGGQPTESQGSDAAAENTAEDDSQNAGSEETSGDTAEAGDTASSDEEITLRIMSSIQTEGEAGLESAMAEQYMADHPNIKIEYIAVANNDLNAQIITLNSSDDLPDAFYMNTAFMPQAKSMGIVIDPTEYLGDDFLNSMDPSIIEYASTDGQLMVVPWFMVPIALIYRADWLEETEYDTIETMEDFRNVGKAFTNGTDRWGFALVGLQNGSGEARFSQYVKAFGVDEIYQDDSGAWVSDLTEDKYRTALQTFVDLDLVDGIVPPGATETGYPEAVTYFANEQAGMIISGSNALGAIVSQNPELDGKLASVPIPSQDRHVTNLQVSGYSITTACEHPQEMADFLKYMADKENAITFAAETGRMPVASDALEDEMFDTPAYQGFVDCIQYALPYPTYSGYSEVQDIMGESYNSMLSGVSIDDAMAQVESRINTLLAETTE
ncbi:MAG: sugar ABC transporter substrate-binding protein [Lachnospiraceae bacterium]|nr:sugar ABC transporter substrate-binding protein [Lachnospiraceae bacterium]